MDSAKAISIFKNEGRPSEGITNSNRESLNYKSLNQTLLRKIAQLKAQVRQSEKKIEALCEENQKLRENNRQLAAATDDEKVELIVEQRVKNRLAHIAAINHRTIQYLQNAGNDMKEALKEIGNNDTYLNRAKRSRTKLGIPPNLENVDESPILVSKSEVKTKQAIIEIDSDRENVFVDSPKQHEENKAEPVMTRKSKGRRSSLLEAPKVNQETPRAAPTNSRRGPLCITSKNNGRKSEKRISKTTSFAKPETPVHGESTSINATTSVRAKRSASLKVKTYTEMPEDFKLRRPDKFDEPLPFVNRFTY